eukprot:9148634-Pyramimonas_sp.AAC.1
MALKWRETLPRLPPALHKIAKCLPICLRQGRQGLHMATESLEDAPERPTFYKHFAVPHDGPWIAQGNAQS